MRCDRIEEWVHILRPKLSLSFPSNPNKHCLIIVPFCPCVLLRLLLFVLETCWEWILEATTMISSCFYKFHFYCTHNSHNNTLLMPMICWENTVHCSLTIFFFQICMGTLLEASNFKELMQAGHKSKWSVCYCSKHRSSWSFSTSNCTFINSENHDHITKFPVQIVQACIHNVMMDYNRLHFFPIFSNLLQVCAGDSQS